MLSVLVIWNPWEAPEPVLRPICSRATLADPRALLMPTQYDVAIVGGGILGLATARALARRFPSARLVVLEKETGVAAHQSGRNSGVIHSGLYYRPGSLKAKLCVSGAEQMVRFCRDRGIDFTRDGKLVVASRVEHLGALAELERRGHANGLEGLRRVDGVEMRAIEPAARGIEALFVPSTGSVHYRDVCEALAAELSAEGVEVRSGFEVVALATGPDGVEVSARRETLLVGGIVNCAGLYSDRLAVMMGVDPGVRIVPFRGEYYDISGPSADLVRSSIYPVPDPQLPFLGVHLTRGPGGSVHAGPNAVLAGAREGYGWGVVRPGELWEALRYRGLRALARRHWRAGIAEVARSMSRRLFTRSVQELVPDVRAEDLTRGLAGVRAQALTPTGELADDFIIERGVRSVHVLNAPSPAATSSLAIGEYVTPIIGDALGLS